MNPADIPSNGSRSVEGSPASLESRLDALTEVVRRMEARVTALESGATEPADLPQESPLDLTRPQAVLPTQSGLLGLIGRVCLILGGATFIRALVDAGTIHRGLGVALGLAYSATWALWANQAKRSLDAAFLALASVLIAYPLLVESTARFGILGPNLGAMLLLMVTGLHAAVAWRRDLQAIIWISLLTSLGSGFVMMATRKAIEPFLTVFLLLGVGSLWLTYGRRWHGLRWPAALAANLGVLILTTLAARPGGPPEAYRGISQDQALLFALALVVVYIGSFALRMLQRRRLVNVFETVQTLLVLLVGFGGALRISTNTGAGAGLLGAGAALVGLGCYGAAIPFAKDQEESRANFNFFTFLALIFILLGSAIVLPHSYFVWLCGVLGVLMMGAGLRLRRTILILQSGLYLGTAALASGLGRESVRAFMGSTAFPLSLSPPTLATLGTLTAALVLFLIRRPPDVVTTRVRFVILTLVTMAATAYGALAVHGLCQLLPMDRPDAGSLAAARTGVLSTLTILLAWIGRRVPALEWRWLVYPLLAVLAAKFLFVDLAVGRPLTLFLGFMCFGTALMLMPRLLKGARGNDTPERLREHP